MRLVCSELVRSLGKEQLSLYNKANKAELGVCLCVSDIIAELEEGHVCWWNYGGATAASQLNQETDCLSMRLDEQFCCVV